MTSSHEQAENLRRAFAEHNIPWPKDATLFWHPTGPKISYGGGMLKVSSLNPETHIQFRMSAKEMLRLGWRCVVIACRIRG
jgi:hypothetical protein